MRKIAAVALVVLLSQGCATTPRGTPVTDKTPRNFSGFSIKPPQGVNWVAFSLRDDTVGFQKVSSSSKHVVLVGVERSPVAKTFDRPEQFLQYINDTAFAGDPRYEFSAREAALSTRYGSFCVKTYYNYRDTMTRRPPDIPYVVHEGRCYVCLHPENKHYEYEICRSEEYAPAQRDSQLGAEEEDFIERFEFSAFTDETKIFLLKHCAKNMLLPLIIKVDGKKVAEMSECGEVAVAESDLGEHRIWATYSTTVVDVPVTRFQVVPGKANYFIVRPKDSLRYPQITVFEVPESEWIPRARAGSGDIMCTYIQR